MTSNKRRPERSTTLWAALLIGIGLLNLAANAGWLSWIVPWIWAALLVAGGGAFLYYYTLNRRQWWALLPGFALLGITAAVVGDDAGRGLFLALIGAGFAGIYASERARWWAIIPAGALITLGVVAWLDSMAVDADTGWVLFLGLAATFGLLYALPEGQGRQSWAVYPALATLLLSLVTIASESVTGIVVPLGLVGAGILLLWRRTIRDDPSSTKRFEMTSAKRTKPPSLIGPLLLIGAGILTFAVNLGWIDWRDLAQVWPLLLIAVGMDMLLAQN